MERKNITIREDQAEWLADTDRSLSKLAQEAIDAEMAPTDDELARAYQENADNAAETADQWAGVSSEATDHLGEPPTDE
jgi:hypothetical protein